MRLTMSKTKAATFPRQEACDVAVKLQLHNPDVTFRVEPNNNGFRVESIKPRTYVQQ